MKALSGLIVPTLLIFSTTLKAQTLSVVDILTRVNQAVLNLKEGRFVFHDKVSKRSTDDDSSHTELTTVCFVKKNAEDSLIGYQLASFREDGYQQVYDGSHLFTVYDQTLEVTNKRNHAGKIKEQLEGFTGPTYLISINKHLHYFNHQPLIGNVRFLGLDYFSGEKCYKLMVNNSQDIKKTSEVFFYVSVHSFLPLRMVSKLKSVVGKAEETLMFDYSITNIEAKTLEVNQFSREKLSDYRLEKNYTPEEGAKDELLPVGSRAPNWKLPLIGGNSMELADLKGKVVVMDFWFKAGAPCQKQMIALQTLHDKFSSAEVVIVGINTIDDPKKDRLELFLKNRLITMPSVYKGNSIESLYKVYGSPALFIIDRQGVIVYTISGYSSTLLDDVSQVIVNQLK